MPFSSLTLIRALESSNKSTLPFLSPTPKRVNPVNTSSPPSPRLKAVSPPSMFCIEAAKSSALPPIAFTA